MRATRFGSGLMLLAATGCSPLARFMDPVRAPVRPVAEVEAALEAAGPEIRPALFAPDATLELRDTVLAGEAVGRFWTAGAGDHPGYERVRYETGGVYVCPWGAIQIGRFTAEQRLPGAGSTLITEGRWLAHWREADGRWEIVDAALRPSLPQVSPFSFDAECVAPSEIAMGLHRTSVFLHWGGLWTHGGAGPGIEAHLSYAGLGDAATTGSTWALGAGRRLIGPWGARAVLARRSAVGTGLRVEEPIELRASTTVVGLLAMHERWLIRVAAGPAVARVSWIWEGSDAPSSSEWQAGWVNEVALAIPVRGRLFLDVAYHDWLFGARSPPDYLGVDGIAPTFRGSSVSIGLGGRF